MSTVQSSQETLFPRGALVGSIGQFAKTMAAGTEVPEEFYMAAGLTCLGAISSDSLTLDVGFDVQPRLYTVLLGDSYGSKKSTAMKKTEEFFSKLDTTRLPHPMYGVGSAEGLTIKLNDEKNVLLLYDEFKTFVDKTKVQSSVLLPMATSLFEQNHWENATKNRAASIQVRDAHLSIIGCCTDATYSSMWTSDAISIGFPNRLFVVHAGGKPRVAWPTPPDREALEAIRQTLQRQIGRLPLHYTIEPDAKLLWESWYNGLPSSEHARRLDTIGFRLLGLVALTTDKTAIDKETVEIVTAIMDYELKVRILTDPIDADNTVAGLEEKIRRQLQSRGPLSQRDLRRHTHADRAGLWAFDAALKNLTKSDDVCESRGLYRLAELSPVLSPLPESALTL